MKAAVPSFDLARPYPLAVPTALFPVRILYASHPRDASQIQTGLTVPSFLVLIDHTHFTFLNLICQSGF
jgi:hypothetical protein